MSDTHFKAGGPMGGVEKTVDEFGIGLVTAAGIGIGIHAAASVIANKKGETNE
jgi:quinone-reactive Ni/Fe-hydrogenase small subunit